MRPAIPSLSIAAALLAQTGYAGQPEPRPPIIDMHLHAEALAEFLGGPPVCAGDQKILFPAIDPRHPVTLDKLATCASPLPAPPTDAEVKRESLAMLERYNIRAVTAGPLERVADWHSAAPHRIIPAASFASREKGPDVYRRLFAERRFAVFAEIGAQYRGLRLDDPSFEPYFALAEELDIPVGVHLGEGPPGAPLIGSPAYRAGLTSPFQLEAVLNTHPRLRLYVMHYASPLVDEMIAVLFSYPQVYVDIAQNNWGFPRAHFYAQLKKLVDAGFEKRILWGSDQMVWPATIPIAIDTIEQAPFLDAEQKRDIFYGNAARFLRLSPAEIARDHGR